MSVNISRKCHQSRNLMQNIYGGCLSLSTSTLHLRKSQQLWKSIKIFYAEYIWGLPLNDGSFNFASQKITNHNNYERQSRSFMQNIRIYIIYGSRLSFSEALTSKSLDKKFTSRIITFTYFHGSCCIILNITNIDAFDKFSTFFNFSSAKIGKLDGWGDDKITLSNRYFFTVAKLNLGGYWSFPEVRRPSSCLSQDSFLTWDLRICVVSGFVSWL